MFTPYNISPFSSLMPRMDSTFFIFELRFHKAPKIYPKPLCYVAPRGWTSQSQGPSLHHVGDAI